MALMTLPGRERIHRYPAQPDCQRVSNAGGEKAIARFSKRGPPTPV
jgi:hypothetical protein